MQVVDRHIRQGLAVRDHVAEITNPKIKRFILVGLDNESMTAKLVMINSEIPGFVKGKPHLECRQMLLSEIDYPDILEHVSYVNCLEVISVDFAKLYNRLCSRQAEILGHLGSDDLAQLIRHLLETKTVSGKDKKVVQKPIAMPKSALEKKS